jgi:hypothetical protein
MTTVYIALLIAAHFIGDWLLQSRAMAHTKSTNMWVLIDHVCIVSFILALPISIFAPERMPLLIINGLLHAFIDWNLWSGYKASIPIDQQTTFEYWKDKRFYDHIACDQFMHLFLIIVLFV